MAGATSGAITMHNILAELRKGFLSLEELQEVSKSVNKYLGSVAKSNEVSDNRDYGIRRSQECQTPESALVTHVRLSGEARVEVTLSDGTLIVVHSNGLVECDDDLWKNEELPPEALAYAMVLKLYVH